MLVFIHIPKTAGTWLKDTLAGAFPPEQCCPMLFEHEYAIAPKEELNSYRFHGAHIGFDRAASLGGRMITVLRDPFDRLVSLYYFWRTQTEGVPHHDAARTLCLEQFFADDQPLGRSDFDNGMTWQLAFGHSPAIRDEHHGISDAELLARARLNLDRIEVVGVTENIMGLAAQLESVLGIVTTRDVGPSNVTAERLPLSEVAPSQRDLLYPLVRLDLALYHDALKRSFSRALD